MMANAAAFDSHQTKEQLEQLAKHMPMAVAILDRDMRYIFVNDRWITDFRLAGQQLVGASHYAVFQEIDEDWKAIHERCLQGAVHRDDQVPFARADGSHEWLRREIRPWFTTQHDVGGLIFYVELITDHMQAQEALKTQRNFLRQVIDLNTSFIFAKDENGRFTLVNKALADSAGTTPDEMIGKYDGDYNPNTHEAANIRSDDLEVIRTRQPKFIPEEPVTHAVSGETRWYQTTKIPLTAQAGDSVQLLGVATDISDRKRAQDHLEAQRNFLRQVIDLNTSFIFAKDENGRFTLVNKALADHYDSTPEDMVGKYDEDFNANREETRHFRSIDLEVIRSRQPRFIPEEPVTNADTGETRWYQTTKIPLRSEDEDSVQLLGVATDITDRKHAQERLQQLVIHEQKARREAEATAKLKDLFMANMSHELRTPLNAIIGFLREMIYSDQLNDDNTHMAGRCLANSKRLLMLINSVLDLSRLATGSLEIVLTEVSPHDLVSSIVEDLQLQARDKGLDLKLKIDPGLPTKIVHDEERLIQITTNLVANAIKFTNEGYVELALKRQADRLLILVSDTGAGIPGSMQAMVFEDFVQLDSSSKRKHGGAGLGLAIVSNLVDLMGGHVSVDSEVGKYSIFTVNLPLELKDLHASKRDQQGGGVGN